MLNFRQFEAGPDPFGLNYQVLLKWLQTAISIRHADTVDVKFLLRGEDGTQTAKTIALPHADLLAVSRALGRPMDDAWCGRLAALHLLDLVRTGEDMDKDLVTVPRSDLERHARELAQAERQAAGA
ncbi:MAG: hypothetical protein ACLQVN_01860 [Bryobacteraceae bacterium]